MQIYCITFSVAFYMFRPFVVDVFREVIFDGTLLLRNIVTTILKYIL